MSEPWHYLENQFDSVTRTRRKLLHQIYLDHLQKLTAGTVGNSNLSSLIAVLNAAGTPWAQRYAAWKNARAAYRGATQTMTNLLDVLRVKPVGGGRSRVEEWDSKIRTYWSPGDPIYDELLPLGREPLTTGEIDTILDEVGRLAERVGTRAQALLDLAGSGTPTPEEAAVLTEQGNHLQTLHTRVLAFSGQLTQARNGQTQKEGAVDQLSGQLKPLRAALCTALYQNLGSLMTLYAANPPEVAAFYDLTLIMAPPEEEEDEDEEEEEPPAGGGGGAAVEP